jgi:predicted component of type VI protein secretion system
VRNASIRALAGLMECREDIFRIAKPSLDRKEAFVDVIAGMLKNETALSLLIDASRGGQSNSAP